VKSDRHRALALLFSSLACADGDPDATRRIAEAVAADEAFRGYGFLDEIAALLGQGLSLPDALARLPGLFPPETTRLLDQAALGQRAAAALQLLGDDHAWIDRRQRETWASMAYPLLLAVGATVLSVLMAVLVMPAFEDVHRSLGSNLPVLSRIALGIAPWIAMVLGIGTALLLLLWLFRLPGLDGLREAAGERLGRWAPVRRYQANGMEPRLMLALSNALDGSLAPATVVAHLRAQSRGTEAALLRRIENGLDRGDLLASVLASMPELPRRLAALLSTLDQRPDTDALRRLAAFTAENALEQRARTRSRLNVLLYVVAALYIALCVVGMYLPIFSLGGVI
jgi:type II secretory pathway component PulF